MGALILLVFSYAPSPRTVNAAQRRYALTIRNESGRDFYRLHMSWSQDKDWGPNRLSGPLARGTAVTLGDIAPAEYDLLLVDGDDSRCIVRGFAVYGDRELVLKPDWPACQRRP